MAKGDYTTCQGCGRLIRREHGPRCVDCPEPLPTPTPIPSGADES